MAKAPPPPTEGDDILEYKGNSDDVINGLGGNDIIDGGAGMDTIDGGEGNDILTGGAHDDTFVFGLNSGQDIVTDFKSGDVLDLSGTGIHDLADLTISDDADGNCVIDMGGGNTITLEKVSTADFLSDPANLVLAEPPMVEDVFLGENDTYTDAGDGTDQHIYADNNDEGLTDTDVFVYGGGPFGDDTIEDFQHEDVDFSSGSPVVIPGDTLDLRAYGILGQDYFGDPVMDAINLNDALIDITFLDANGNTLFVGDPGTDDNAVTSILHIDTDADGTADSTLTLIGVDYVELGVALEWNTMLADGTTLGNA